MKNVLSILSGTIMLFAMISCEKLDLSEPGNLVPKTVDQDPNIPSITVNGVMLHSEAFGHPDSTMIVCIHGGPGSDYRYMLNCKDLANYGYRVVFYDQRGSGLSQRLPESSYTSQGIRCLDLIYDELSGVIAYYRTSPNQKVFLLGHSWGAMLATAYAGKHPDSIQGLSIQEPGGLKWEDVMEYVNSSRSFSFWGEFLNDAAYIDQFITGKENDHEILDYKFGLLGSSNNPNTDDGNSEPGNFWRLGAVINTGLIKVGMEYKPDFSEGISNFNIPVLFFYSEYSKSYNDSWANKITSVFNEVEICKVPGTGHGGILTDNKAWKETTLPRMLSYFNSL
jgi:proline iminopeptidase